MSDGISEGSERRVDQARYGTPGPRGPWCVECQQEKKGDNHWFKYAAGEGFFLLLPLDAPEHGVPVCGEVCASKRVSRWMSEQVRQRPSV